MRHRISVFLPVLCLVALAACGDDEPFPLAPCETDATCGGYRCQLSAGSATGACSSSCAGGCASGFECGEDTLQFACVPVGSDTPPVVGDECNSDAMCGGYACLIAAGATTGACSSSCADGCAPGFECGEDTLEFACVPVGSDPPPVVGDECNSDAMCGGYACLIAAGATTGVCSTSCEEGCAVGFFCGGLGNLECWLPGEGPTCADLDCGLFSCDETLTACFVDCTADNAEEHCATDTCEVVEGAEIGVCVAEPEVRQITYVAVVSRSEDVEGGNPGPDIDAIGFFHGGVYTVAEVVEASMLGWDDGDYELTRTRPGAVLAKDVQRDDGSCNLDDWEPGRPDYFSMGGEGGFVVVSFGVGAEIVDRDVIEVIEIGQGYCWNVGVARDDIYEVYVGLGTLDLGSIASADDITFGDWCLIGASSGGGGVFSDVFRSAGCVLE